MGTKPFIAYSGDAHLCCILNQSSARGQLGNSRLGSQVCIHARHVCLRVRIPALLLNPTQVLDDWNSP